MNKLIKKAFDDVVVLIPAYNEATSLSRVIPPLINSGYHVLCVDDGSTDETSKMAEFCGAIVIRHPINLGQGAALETGFEYVRQHLNPNTVLVTFDADGQHNPLEIEFFVDKIRRLGFEVVLGSRFLSGTFQGGLIKKMILRIMSRLARFTLGLKISDRHNGFRAFSLVALMKIRLRNAGFGHADEILRHIKSAKLKYVEQPTAISYSDYSRSKGQPLINGFRIVLDRILGAP